MQIEREAYLTMFTKLRQTKSKYNNVKQTFNGRSYDSKAEAKIGMWLEDRKKKGEIKDYHNQVPIDLYGENGTRVARYKIDFVIDHNDGSEEYLEVKGFETAVWRLKWKLTEDKFKEDHNKKLTLLMVWAEREYNVT